MAHQQPKGHLGWASLIKTGGQTATGPALLTRMNFPVPAVNPRNPKNRSYLPVMNASAGPSIVIDGKRTPTFAFRGIPAKVSWLTLTNIMSWIGGSDSYLDSFFNSDVYAIGRNDGSNTLVYDGSQCMSVSFYQVAAGGGIYMDMDWLCQYGDSEASVPTVFTAPATDSGTTYDVTKVDFNATASDPHTWRFTMMRAQGYQMLADGTVYSAPLQSGGVGGMFSLVTTPLAATVPGASVQVKLGTAGTGVSFTFNTSLDDPVQDVGPTLGTKSFSYTLGNFTSGGYPWAIATF